MKGKDCTQKKKRLMLAVAEYGRNMLLCICLRCFRFLVEDEKVPSKWQASIRPGNANGACRTPPERASIRQSKCGRNSRSAPDCVSPVLEDLIPTLAASVSAYRRAGRDSWPADALPVAIAIAAEVGMQ